MKKKILVLSNMYPSKFSKTFGIFVKNQVELLRKKGLSVDVVAVRDPRKGKAKIIRKYLYFFLQSKWKLLLAGRSYQAVHVHYIFPTGLIGLLFKKIFGTRLIVTSHGGDIDQMVKKSSWSRRMTQRVLDESDHVIAVGHRLKEEIHTNFSIPNEKIAVINMGVNRSVFKPIDKEEARKKVHISADEQMLLFVGNLIEAKGLIDLVEAFRIAKKDNPNLTLHLIGEPKNAAFFERFEALIKDEESIVVHEALPQSEIAVWMSAADLFILPSHIEGFGLVALEAMACELPVIGTDVGGLTYLLDNESGLKAQPHNPEDLADKIKVLIRDSSLQNKYVDNALRKVEQFDQEKLIGDVIELYEGGHVHNSSEKTMSKERM